MAWGRRCDMGCESWPDDKKYTKCPICGEDAERFSNLNPLTAEEASHALFEHFYAKWDANHDPARLDADAPDARGKYANPGTRLVRMPSSAPRSSA